MKQPPWNRHLSCIIKSALLGGLLIATTALAFPPNSNPIQSFSASPSTITAGQTTTLSWVVEGAKDVRLSGVSATPASSAVVGPTHTTTYTLTATTAWGKSVSQDVIVNVTAAFEETLWAPDVLFEYANIGAVGFNFHSNDWNSFNQWDAYAAFHFYVPEAQFTAAYSHYSAADGVPTPAPVPPPPGNHFTSQYQVREIQALYYGMLFFAEATAHQGRLLPVMLDTSANLKAWATLDPTNGDVNIAIINKDKTASGSVQLTVPGYKRGLVKRLLAPSFSSITGITIGGQTFDGSQDGKAVGTSYGEFIRSQNGTFEVSVGPTSAFLLTLHKRERDYDRDDD